MARSQPVRLTSVLWCAAILTSLCSARSIGGLPIAFEPNQGQTDARVRYLARSGDMIVFITRDGYTLSAGGQSVSMQIAGASRTARIAGEQPLEGVSNYYLSGRAISGVPHFDRVRAGGVQPGIDAVFYGREHRIEYDFLLEPGADPKDITLRFTGAGSPHIDANGDLILRSGDIEFRHHKPVAWQGNQSVECAYALLPNGAVRFKLGAYDKRRALTIDPVLSYSTYFGGSNFDAITALAVDGSGSVYLTGNTRSTDFPVTSGAPHGGSDAFIAKLNPSGTALVYSTYIGGSQDDGGAGIAVDSSGNAYATGYTTSSDFLTGYKGSTDVFAVKLGPAGTMIYGTLFGGINSDTAKSIAVDTAGAAYIAGSTNSTGLATSGAAQTVFGGYNDAFVAKLTAAGAISYFTYVGGGDADSANAIAVDASGNAYVAGDTSSNNFPVTPDALDNSLSGSTDGFIAVLNANGTARIYSSYLGGSGTDSVQGIALGSAGSVYVAGTTESPDFPTTPGAFATTKPGYSYYNSGFAAKFVRSPSWAAAYSTYFGGTDGNDVRVNGIAVDASGQAVLVGSTGQATFPTTPGALARVKPSSYYSDLFLLQFNAAGNSIVYSTLLGGTSDETAVGVALDPNGGAYIAGSTTSPYFPTTPGAFRTVNPRNTSSYSGVGVVSKIDLSSPVSCVPQITPPSANVAARGGSAAFQLTLAAGCPWLVSADTGLTVAGAQAGMGAASPISFNVTVAPNDSIYSSRAVALRIGDASFTVNQPAWSCTDPVINPSSLTFDSSGGIRTIAVSMPSSCSWTTSASSPWLNITDGAAGSGSRNVTVYAAQNSFAARSTSITIGGQSVPIAQTGGSCTATASGSPLSFNANGGSGSMQITTQSTCRWAAYSNAPWIQVNASLSTGQGSGAAPFNVAQNPGAVTRTGTLTIGDQTVVISQAAGPVGAPTSYSAITIAGTTNTGFSGDGGPAIAAYLYRPAGLALSGSTLYIADANNSRIRAITSDGLINTVVGGGSSTADGVAPTSAQVSFPVAVAVDPSSGYLYFNDGCRVRRALGSSTTVTTVAGSTLCGFAGDNGPASSALLNTVNALAVDSTGSVYIADSGRVRKVTGGTITTVAGGGVAFADGGSPTATNLGACGIALDAVGALYVWDCQNSRIRKVAGGVITTIAGGGSGSGDGVPATSVSIYAYGSGIAVDQVGAVYFGDSNRIRKVTPAGLIYTISSPSTPIQALGIAVEPAANLFVSDYYSGSIIRKMTPNSTFCIYSASTPALQPSAGGALSINITAAAGCGWQASLNGSAPWVTLSGADGNGNGAVSVTLAANTGVAARTATLLVAGQSVAITQSGVNKAASDFNGDGVPDLVWVNESTRQVVVHYYGGAGGASYQGYNWLNTSGASGWRVVAVADFNGDGVSDLVWQNEATGQASVHYYGGSGGAVDQGWSWLYTGSAPGWKIVAAADFNGDGVPDLVWQNEATRQVVVHYYGGSGGAVDQGWAWLYGGVATGWRVVAAADFNGDGVPDLVWQSETTRQVSVHYYGGSGGAVDQGWKWLNAAGAPGWKVVAATDFNTDAVPDLVWMNDTTRQVTVHYYGGQDGAVYQGYNWLNASGAPGWIPL